MGITYEIAQFYVKGYSMTRIKKEKELHQEEIRRNIKKALKWFLENYEPDREVDSIISEKAENVTP